MQTKLVVYADHFAGTAIPAKAAEFPRLYELYADTHLNHVGQMVATIKAADQNAPALQYGRRVELWYKNDDIANWTKDWTGIIVDQRGSGVLTKWKTIKAVTPEWLLTRRNIAWTQSLIPRSLFLATRVDEIVYTLIVYNMTISATTANLRHRTIYGGGSVGYFRYGDGTVPSFTMPTTSLSCHDENLLDVIQNLSEEHGFDFDVTPISGSYGYQFNLYPTGKGTDKTASVKFAEGLRNMDNASVSLNRETEKTVALAKGPDTKNPEIVTGPDYSAANDAELFVYAVRAGNNTAAIRAKGLYEVNKYQAKEKFFFTPRTIGKHTYGVDYAIGDTVAVLYDGAEYKPKIIRSLWQREQGKAIKHEIAAGESERKIIDIPIPRQISPEPGNDFMPPPPPPPENDQKLIQADRWYTSKETGDASTPWTYWGDTISVGGFSSFTSKVFWYQQIGKLVRCAFRFEGISNANSLTFTIPVTISSATMPTIRVPVLVMDNGTNQIGYVRIPHYTSYDHLIIYPSPTISTWTASGAKAAQGEIWYLTD
ncbi:MAG: Gp37-like protein [Chloroflexota bacterium]